MNFEQINIRLAIDAKAVKTGLGKASAEVKAWGASIAQGMKSQAGNMMKGFIGAEAVGKAFEYLDEVKDKILEVARISKETGANTNFIQGLEQDAAKAGTTFQGMDMWIIKLNKTIGEAKMGDVEAVKKMNDLGVATSYSEIKTMTLTKAMHNLSGTFDSLKDKQKQGALLFEAGGKGADAISVAFEKGQKHIDDLSKGSFFTKMSEGAIGDFETIWRSFKAGAQSSMATVVNLLDSPVWEVRKLTQYQALLGEGILPGTKEWKEDMASLNKAQEGLNENAALQVMADKDGIDVAHEKLRLKEEEIDLTQKLTELKSQVDDRDKMSVEEMDSKFKQITGQKSLLERFHTVTPLMRQAHNIKTLEERAQIQNLRGDKDGAKKLQDEADQIRGSNSLLKRQDQFPMEKTNAELVKIQGQLDDFKSGVGRLLNPQ